MKQADILATYFVSTISESQVIFWYMDRATFEARKGKLTKSAPVPWPIPDQLQAIIGEFEQSFPGKLVSVYPWRDFWILLHNAGFVEEKDDTDQIQRQDHQF